MKNILFTLMLILSIPCFAQQNKAEGEKSKSKAVEFMSQSGTLIRKDFYDIHKDKYGVTCQVLILTNIVNNKKSGCLRLKTEYFSSVGTDTYIGTLDSDEIDAAIKSLKYIAETLVPTSPETYTEVEYSTRDNMQIGAFTSDGTWEVYVQTKSYTSRSMSTIKADKINEFIGYLEQSKQLITEKVGSVQ